MTEVDYRALAEGSKDEFRLIHYHGDERRFTDGFPDAIHHNSIWVIGLHRAGALDRESIMEFARAINDLLQPDGSLIRHKRTPDPLSRDGYVPLIRALTVCGIAYLRDFILDYVMREVAKQPHHRAHFLRSAEKSVPWHLRVLTPPFELGDILFDKVSEILIPLKLYKYKYLKFLSGRNGVDSSVVKNIVRAEVLEKNHVPLFNASEVFKRYFGFKHGDDHKVPYFIALPWEVWFKQCKGQPSE